MNSHEIMADMSVPVGWHAIYHRSNSVYVTSISDVGSVCPHCGRSSTFQIKATHCEPIAGSAHNTRCHVILRCNFPPCVKITYASFTVAAGYQPEATEFFIHPYPGVDIPHPAIPSPIVEDWQEAQKALAISATKAAAVMARRVLYGVLLDQKCKEHPMHEGLKELIDKVRLPTIFDQWLLAIRDDGHDAAHPYRALIVNETNVTETMAYTAELLRFVYIEPYEFAQRLARTQP